MLWSCLRRVSISPAIAFRCGSEVAEQITKKSVNVEISRRSRITISSAFLFDANSPQVIANFSGVISILLIEASAVDDFVHGLRYEITNGPTRRNPVSDIGCG